MQGQMNRKWPVDTALSRTEGRNGYRPYRGGDVLNDLNDPSMKSRLTSAERSEASVVMEALRKSGGVTYTAAVLIGMKRSELLEKMDKYGIPER